MISVVIPLYNKAHTIVNTLKTVFAQTYQDFEIVIVNDGSTDNSVEVIQQHFNDSRIRIIHQKNAGVSAARNRGVDESNGEWIAFLDADDEWMPQYLYSLINALKKYPSAEMIGCASYHKDFLSGKISANALIDKYYKRCVQINYFMNPDKMTHIGATIIKKEIFKQVGGFDCTLINNEDLLLQSLIAMRGHFVYVGDCLHIYVGNVPGQTTSDISKRRKRTMNNFKVLNQIYTSYHKNNIKNRLIPISIKFRGRHALLGLLKEKQYPLIKDAMSQLDSNLQKKIFISTKVLETPLFNKFCIIYIYITKIIWRTHRFPRVGTLSRYNTELTNKYKTLHD